MTLSYWHYFGGIVFMWAFICGVGGASHYLSVEASKFVAHLFLIPHSLPQNTTPIFKNLKHNFLCNPHLYPKMLLHVESSVSTNVLQK